MFRFGHMGMMGWGGSGFMIFFWIIVIGFIYYIVTNNKNSDNKRGQEDNMYKYKKDSAEEIARQRYARGEISKEEYNEILNNLRQ